MASIKIDSIIERKLMGPVFFSIAFSLSISRLLLLNKAYVKIISLGSIRAFFVGRVPILVSLSARNELQLAQVLTELKNALAENVSGTMEQTLLIPKAAGFPSSTNEANGEGFENAWRARFQEIKNMGRLAGPMILLNLNQFLLSITSLAMAGHVDQLSLSGASIATSIANVSGFSVLIGLSGALDTLCGQAFGARQYRKVGTVTCTAIFCLILASIPIAIAWIYMENILVFIGQEPAISAVAGGYTCHLLPALLAAAFIYPLQKFLQFQSLIYPMLVISFSILCLHVIMCWSFVYKLGMGANGAAVATCISYWCNAVFFGTYIAFSSACEKTRPRLSNELFGEVKTFLRYAIPSSLMMCLEWWSFEFLILLSGLLPNPELETSVLSICLTTLTMLYAIPYGIGGAGSIRISNELGAGNFSAARTAVHSAVLLAFIEGIVVGATLFFCRNVYGYLYSNEEGVVEYAASIAHLVTMSVFLDSIQGVLSGVARGCGWQHVGAYINFGAFYLCGIPAAVLLAFVAHLRGRGLWLGILMGAFTQSSLLGLVVVRINWREQAVLAGDRVIDGVLC